jgi:hypothetical protein
MIKSPNLVLFIRLFVRLLNKNKVDTSTSTIDQSAQIDFDTRGESEIHLPQKHFEVRVKYDEVP